MIKTEIIDDKELQRLRNTLESSLIYSEVSILNKAVLLAFFGSVDKEDEINTEADLYQAITQDDIITTAKKVFIETNCNEIIYQKIE